MKIEIWSDVVCPWRYIGSRNLDEALAAFDHADGVEFAWKSHELDPDAPTDGGGSYVDRLTSDASLSYDGEGVTALAIRTEAVVAETIVWDGSDQVSEADECEMAERWPALQISKIEELLG